jgi:hypothetical protein
MTLLANDPLFDEQATRTLAHAVHGGADFGECLTTMERVPSGDTAAWTREWTATADRVAAIGDAYAAHGNAVSAREARCAPPTTTAPPMCSCSARRFRGNLTTAFEREAATFAKAAPRFDPALEPVEIPFEGPRPRLFLLRRTVRARCSSAPTATIRRCTKCICVRGRGAPSWLALPAVRRTWRGRALFKQRLVMRPDWENVVRPVVDLRWRYPASTRRASRLSGWSFGGYLALRAAAGEPRLAACVADPGMTGLAAPMAKMFAALPASALADPLAADPAVFAPYVQKIEATPALRWRVVQRAYMVHGVASLPAISPSPRT